MDVRCCCNPGKLLGFIPLTEDDVGHQMGKRKVPGVDGKPVEIEVAWLGSVWSGKPAVKSNDLPIEYYEKIAGWLPATGPDKISIIVGSHHD